MLHNNIVNLLMHTPSKKVLLPLSQKRIALPSPNYNEYESIDNQYKYKPKPYEFSS